MKQISVEKAYGEGTKLVTKEEYVSKWVNYGTELFYLSDDYETVKSIISQIEKLAKSRFDWHYEIQNKVS